MAPVQPGAPLPSPPSPSPLLWIIAALVAVLAILGLTLGGLALAGRSSAETTTAFMAVAAPVIGGLVALLATQTHLVHVEINSRMTQLLEATRGAAYAQGQATPPVPPQVQEGGSSPTG